MNKGYIAVDIGASSGRLIVGQLVNNQLKLKEIHRFKNEMYDNDGHNYWNIENLYNEILEGMRRSNTDEICYESIGVDTWAVDYVLLDREGTKISPIYAYRDHRTDKTMEKVFKLIPKEIIYEKTGIQFLQFNTIYQLYEHSRINKDLKKAHVLMMIPDYLHYKLSGVASIEYTNASSTQLLDVNAKHWDDELLKAIQVNKEIFAPLVKPGTVLGKIKDEVVNKIGLKDLKVVAPATHDTGSAVVSVPSVENNFAYISSGTWSLMGIESKKPINNHKASTYNFTNEGGVFDTYRVLKNIMGLWLIQEVQRQQDYKYSFAEYVELAQEVKPLKSMINPNDKRFLNPVNMVDEIKAYCAETKQYIPETPGEIARCIFESLALLYKNVLEQLNEINDSTIEKIHIIGGGCQNKMLNQLCADFTGIEVWAGPIEATAIGNLAMQMITGGDMTDLTTARAIIRNSFNIETYSPRKNEKITAFYEKFRRLQDE